MFSIECSSVECDRAHSLWWVGSLRCVTWAPLTSSYVFSPKSRWESIRPCDVRRRIDDFQQESINLCYSVAVDDTFCNIISIRAAGWHHASHHRWKTISCLAAFWNSLSVLKCMDAEEGKMTTYCLFLILIGPHATHVCLHEKLSTMDWLLTSIFYVLTARINRNRKKLFHFTLDAQNTNSIIIIASMIVCHQRGW